MNYLLRGGYNPQKLELMLSLTSIRSEDIRASIHNHLVDGCAVDLAAALNGADVANLKRALKKLNEIASIVEEIKNIDLYKRVAKVTEEPKPKKAKFDPAACIPDLINAKAWSEWCEFRKGKRKPVSQAAAKKQLAMLEKYPTHIQKQIIDSSIQNDYQGLFPPKGGFNGQNQPARSSHAQRSESDTAALLAYADSIENGHGFMGANGSAVPQQVDSSRGAGNGEWPAVEQFQLVAEEDGTVIDRRVRNGDGSL